MARRRRWLRWVLIGVGSLVLLLVGLALAIVWIPSASRFVLVEALTRWDATNPARLEWRSIEGSLGRGLRVEQLALFDGDARPLLRVDRLALELGFWSLLRGTATVEQLRLVGVEVWTAHAWGDLADPNAPPEPPEPGYGPDLPLEILATVVLEDGRVWLDAREHIDVARLDVWARGEGREAEAELSAAEIAMPTQALRIDSLALAARWDSPHAYLDRLQLDSPLLTVDGLRGDYDVALESGALALDADAHLDAIAERFELPLEQLGERARIDLRARGGPAKLELGLDLGLGAAGELHVHAAGVPTGATDRRWLGARVRGRIGVVGPMCFDLLASVRGRPGASGLVAELRADVHDLHSGERLQLRADASARSLEPAYGRATVSLDGAGLQLDARLRSDASELFGRWTLHVTALERPLGLLARTLGEPALADIHGRIEARGRCAASPSDSLASLQCVSTLQLARASGYGVGVSSARLRARIEPLANPLALDATLRASGVQLPEELTLDALEVDARGTLARLHVDASARGPHERAQLSGAVSLGEWIDIELDRLALHSDRGRAPTSVALRRPTRLRITDTQIDIHALSLAAADGTIDVDGRLGLAAGNTSDLRMNVDALQLARLDPLLPGPSLAGALSLRATLSGALPEPDVWVDLRGQDLRVAGLRPGDVELVVAFGWPPPLDARLDELLLAELGEHTDAGLRVWARAHGPMASRFTLAAALPLRLAAGPHLLSGLQLAARMSVDDVDLVELGALMPDTPSWWRQRSPEAAAPPGDPKLIPEGRVDLDLALAGTAEHPRVDAQLVARELVIDRTKLGSLRAHARFDEAGAGLELAAKPGFAQLELRARVPMQLDLRRGALEWTREHEGHVLSLDVRGLDLDRLRATLGPKLPALEQALAQAQIQGVVSLSLRGTGSLAQPHLAAALRAGDLRHREQPIGRVRLLANYAPGDAQLDVEVHGPLARRLDAHVHAPLGLSIAEQSLRLDRERELSATIHVDELSLAALARHVGPLPIAGSVTAAFELDGTLAQPHADLRASVEELATAQAVLGSLLLRVGIDDGRLRIDADMAREGAQILAAALELPLILELTPELAGSEVRWDQRGHHQLFVTGQHIDESLLAAALGRDPRSSTTIAPLARGRETNLAFDITGAGSVDAFKIDGKLGGKVAVDDELALALAVDLALDQASQRLALTLVPSRGTGLTGSLELAARVPALIAGEQPLAEVPLLASIAAPDFDLHALSGVLPEAVVDPRGSLHADVHAGGVLGAPRLRGALELDDAAITVVAMRQRLTDIALALTMNERRVDLRDLSLAAGRGGMQGHGHIEMLEGKALDGALRLTIADFPLIRPGMPAMIVDTGVELDLHRQPGETSMAVVLREPEVTVAGANEAVPEPIPSSDDVVIASAGVPTIDTTDTVETDAAAPTESERFELRVELREPLLISGAAIDMAWAGSLQLDVDGGQVEVGGQVEARRGRLRLFGNSFDLRRGVVTLPDDGTLDPYLDLEAVASLPEAEVTVTVTGRVSRPSLEFSSNPALSEYEILTLLITGSTEIGESDGDVAAKAASLLAAVSNPQLQNQLNQRLGIDRVAIGFGETIDQPIFTVGKRFGRDVYVETEYHHNAPEDQNTTQLAIEYGFLPRWSLEGFFGDAAVGALGIYWNRTFPAAKWASGLKMPDLQIDFTPEGPG